MNYSRGHFINKLKTEQLSRWQWRLTEPLVYADPEHGTITVPAGFVTNFASIRILRTIATVLIILAAALSFLPDYWLSRAAAITGLIVLALYATIVGYANAASTVHDYLYTLGRTDEGCTLTQKEADEVIYRAARAEAVAKWRAFIFYAGPRIGGSSHYGKV